LKISTTKSTWKLIDSHFRIYLIVSFKIVVVVVVAAAFHIWQMMLSAEHHMVCGWLFEWEIMHGRVDIIWPNTRNGAMVDALFFHLFVSIFFSVVCFIVLWTPARCVLVGNC
jgi:hypothetical protein